MLHPIADKTEISVEFSDKAYIVSFGRNSNSMPTPTGRDQTGAPRR